MKKLLTGVFVVLSLFLTSPMVNAQNTANISASFSTQKISENEKKSASVNINVKCLSDYNDSFGIICFDVSNNGQIAIGLDRGTKKTVYVFDSDGKYNRGYDFSIYGSFYLGWDEDNLLIYIVRGNIVVSIDFEGKVTDVQKIENTSENDSYWNKLRSTKSKTVGDKTYFMKNDVGVFGFFSTSYSQMVVKTRESETVIYDASIAIILRKTLIIIIVAFIILVTVYSVLRRFSSKSIFK